MNSRKEIKIRAFGCAMENSPENDFQCLVTFWKCYFPTNFSHFLSFQTNFILENPPAPAHQHPQKMHRYPHKTYHHTTQKPPKHHHPHHHNNNNKKIRDQREKDWEIEGKRDRSGKRDRFSAVATRSVLGGDDDNKMQGSDLNGGDVEEEERKKRKLGQRVIWAMGRHDLGWLELGWSELGDGFWTMWGVCSCSSSLSLGVVSERGELARRPKLARRSDSSGALSLSSGCWVLSEVGNDLKVKWVSNWFYRVRGSLLRSTEIYFQFDRIFMCIQTPSRV